MINVRMVRYLTTGPSYVAESSTRIVQVKLICKAGSTVPTSINRICCLYWFEHYDWIQPLLFTLTIWDIKANSFLCWTVAPYSGPCTAMPPSINSYELNSTITFTPYYLGNQGKFIFVLDGGTVQRRCTAMSLKGDFIWTSPAYPY
jgi:hypothetical protein